MDFNHKDNDYMNDMALDKLAEKYTAPGTVPNRYEGAFRRGKHLRFY